MTGPILSATGLVQVVGDDQNPLLSPHVQFNQRPRRSPSESLKVAVGELAAGMVDGDLACAGLQVAAEQVGGDVVAVGQLELAHPLRECSFGP